MDLRQINMEDMFDPSLRRVWRSRSPGTKTSIFRPFWRPACCFRLVKHL